MEATIGPDSWKTSTINNIKLAQTVVQRSDKFNDLGRQLDPLPSLKDNCIQQSNAQIHSYVRATRSVVIRLRDNLLDTEEEIKSLLRGKENLEKALEHIRKDILLNEQSRMGRKAKPLRERVSVSLKIRTLCEFLFDLRTLARILYSDFGVLNFFVYVGRACLKPAILRPTFSRT